ncbi:hypothetical protein Patl1_07263 [Pistacia atlantica]|uniref:Uncharacterized protein n=1 Tax=Pistacia atlantica TaxID=434234 RepID=A0ACC1AFW9_9ROSI|nr:hypothetical protein Patl1_07263 [Pistacia atlantica]
MNNNFIDFRELIMVFLSELEEKHLAEFGVVVSKIWQRRNEFTFKQHLSTPSQIIHHTTQELDMLNSLHQSRTSTNAHPQIPDPSSPRWQPPLEGIYKINWDASVRKVDCTIGVGIAIWDWQDKFMATMRMKKTMFPDAYLAESFAALQAVILAADIGINQIILEGDTLQVVNDLLRDEENWGQAASNVIVHTLAKDTLTIDDVLVELEDVPNCIGSLVDPIE